MPFLFSRKTNVGDGMVPARVLGADAARGAAVRRASARRGRILRRRLRQRPPRAVFRCPGPEGRTAG